MDRLYIDTNIIIDVIEKRDPFYYDSYKILDLCAKEGIVAFTSASAITDLFYIINKKTKNAIKAKEIIGNVLKIIIPAPISLFELTEALDMDNNDYEDMVAYTVAKDSYCDYIITRNTKDFKGLDIKAITPMEYLSLN